MQRQIIEEKMSAGGFGQIYVYYVNVCLAGLYRMTAYDSVKIRPPPPEKSMRVSDVRALDGWKVCAHAIAAERVKLKDPPAHARFLLRLMLWEPSRPI